MSKKRVLITCPKLSETRSWVQNFNGGNETVVTNVITPNQPYTVGSISGTGAMIDVFMSGHPNGAILKTYVAESGWKEGMPVATEDVADGQIKRWTWTDYTQDNTALAYILNPRVKETRVGDAANVKKTAIEYHMTGTPAVAQYGLVKKVEVGDLSTVLKKVETDFNLLAAYIDKRIIGLPLETRVWGKNDVTQNLEFVSKMTYGYDEENFTLESNQAPSLNPATHDNTNYGLSFIAGRGNLTSTTRHDVTGQTAAVTSKTRYDIAGSVVAQLDPLDRKVRIEYADAFNDLVNRNSFAYPTKVYDHADNFSLVKYRFDIGANVWAKSPNLNATTPGKETTREYDDKGRIVKDTIVSNGAYTRYEYPLNGVQSKIYSTISDTNNSGVGDTADEVFSEVWADGEGRPRWSRTEHPGSNGGWRGSRIDYDVLGRVARQSVPTEITVPNAGDPESWTPAGDDLNRGWLYTHQKYDWKDRIVRKINTDGVDSPAHNDSDTLITYEGCGCAGGVAATVQTERVSRDDMPGTSGRRTQKIYEDSLGRQVKNEVLDWNGNIYQTVTKAFNGSDQEVLSRVFAGSEASSEYLETISTFDGHGRLHTQRTPRQSSNISTVYTYFDDDKPKTVTDSRGSIKSYQYNSLGLIRQVSFQSPATASIVFAKPMLTAFTGNIDGSIYKMKFKGVNIDNNAELSVDILVNNGTATQNLRYTNLQRSTEGGEAVLVFDIASDSYLYNYVNSNSYVIGFTVVNPDSGKRTQTASADYLNGQNGRYVRILFEPPAREYSIAETPTVDFQYNNAGNRTAMTDGFGSVTYEYNSLSQLVAETRQFNEIVPTAPLPNNQFRIQYSYDLSGRVRTLTEPYGEVVTYSHERNGNLKSISGNRVNEGVQLTYVSDAKYRAWGAVKRVDYDSTKFTAVDYNNRLLPENFAFSTTGGAVSPYQFYNYHSDGVLKRSLRPTYSLFDRSYDYDFLGRLKIAKSGLEVHGPLPPNSSNSRPYRVTLGYNAFGDTTYQERLSWGASFTSTFEFQNGHLATEVENQTIPGWTAGSSTVTYDHDADGRLTTGLKYDAAGQLARVQRDETEPVSGHPNEEYVWVGTTIKYDGDSNQIKTVRDGQLFFGSVSNVERRSFQIRSSVVGSIITTVETDWHPSTGYSVTNYQKIKRSIFANGEEIAERRTYQGAMGPYDDTVLKTSDPSGVDKFETTILGTGVSARNFTLDPLGANADITYPEPPPSGWPDPNDPNCVWNDYDDYECNLPDEYDEPESEDQEVGSIPENTCYVDGVETDCDKATELLQDGDAFQCPHNQCTRAVRYNGQNVLATYRVMDDGFAGYVPANTLLRRQWLLNSCRPRRAQPFSSRKPAKYRSW